MGEADRPSAKRTSGLDEQPEICERDEFSPAGPSKLAENVRHLKGATWAVIEKRERLPQPLFWSLFHAEIREIKERKEKKRLERALFLRGADNC